MAASWAAVGALTLVSVVLASGLLLGLVNLLLSLDLAMEVLSTSAGI